jgi:ferritin
MATANAKNRLKKKLDQLNTAQEKVEELAEVAKQAKDEYLIELMRTLQTKLGTDDLDELESFINTVRPLQKTQNHVDLESDAMGSEVNNGN